MNSKANGHKSLTELAVGKKRRAHEERERGERYGPGIAERFAEPFEREAAALLTLPGTPDLGAGGEVVRPYSAPDGCAVTSQPRSQNVRPIVRGTLGHGATRIAEDASIQRTDLLL
jgi:hypothetical protein